MKPDLAPVIHESCADLPTRILPHLLAQAKRRKRGQTWIFTYRVGREAATVYLTRGNGADNRLHVSPEPMPMPGITRECGRKPVTARRETPTEWGPRMWREFHTATRTQMTLEKWRAFLRDFASRLPSGGCRCQQHWTGIVAEHPGDDLPQEEREAWGYDRHNDVNARLGKPKFLPGGRGHG